MYLDALTVSALADELRQTILGGRIQRVVLASPLSLGLEVYHGGRRHYLLISADPRHARVHLLADKPTRGVEHETPLTLLLRKYVRNGIVERIEQPDLERMLVLSILKHPAPRKDADEEDDGEQDFEERRCELVCELMGQRSNIVLVDDDNLILDAVKRIPGDGNRRAIMPREVYVAPPRPVGRRDPRAVTAHGLTVLLEGAERDLGKAIVGAYHGVSPQQAREVISRTLGQSQVELRPDLPFEALADALRQLWSVREASSLAFRDDTPIAFAPYTMRQYPDVRPTAGVSAALATFYASAEQVTAHAQRRDSLRQRIGEARERVQRQHDALSRELARAADLDRLRWEGEMIFGYLHAIEPGQRTLEVEGATIKLNPERTAVENAQARFREYDKAKGAVAGVPERLASVDAQLRYLDETLALLDLADGYEAIAAIERELQEQGVLKASGKKEARGPRSVPLRLLSSDGIPIHVGRSAGQNEQVTFRIARPEDLWLHVRDMPGAHVVVQVEGDLPDRTVEEAAGLAAYFSAARGSTSAEVIMTLRRNVRKIPGGQPGLVSFRNERTIRAVPLAPAALQADKQKPDQH